MSHCDMAHTPTPIPTAIKNLEAKAALEKEWTKLQKLLAWDESKVTGRAEVIQVVLRGDSVTDDSRNYAVFTEQGASALHVTAAKVLDVISRLRGCAAQASDAVSAHTQVKMKDALELFSSFGKRLSNNLDQKTECKKTR